MGARVRLEMIIMDKSSYEWNAFLTSNCWVRCGHSTPLNTLSLNKDLVIDTYETVAMWW